MGVNTKSFDNASDMITFSRASGGYGLTKVSYGPELVTNGDFATDSDWTLSTGATISGGVLTIDYTVGTNGAAQTLSVTAGKIYQVSINVSGSGSARISFAGEAVVLDNGDNLYNFVATDTSEFRVRSHVNFSGTIDNISVREVTYNSSAADATLQLTYHPNDVPRIEYDLDGTAKGLLVEESRTNNLPYSEDFTEWTALGVTVNSNNVISPDKNLNGTKLTSSGSGTQRVGRNINTTGVNCYSVFAKKGTHSYLQILDGSDAEYYVNFDLDSGSVGTSGSKASGQIQDFGNGWYRCTMVTDGTSSTSKFYIYLTSNASSAYGDSTTSTNYFYIYGAQFEAGAFPTSYIKSNSGSTTTRSADVASIFVADFGYNQSAGTVVVDANPIPSGAPIGDQGIVSFDNGTVNDEIILLNENNDRCRLIIDPSGGSNDVDLKLSGAEGSEKYAAAWRINDAQIAHGGLIGAGDTSTTPPTTITRLNVGSVPNAPLNGHIKSIKYYPRRLTDAQLQELTT